MGGCLGNLPRRRAELSWAHDDPLPVSGGHQSVILGGRRRPGPGVEIVDVDCRPSRQFLDLALAQIDPLGAGDGHLGLLIAAPASLDRRQLPQAVGVNLAWQVERRVCEVQVLGSSWPIRQAGDADRAEDRLQASPVAGLRSAMEERLGVYAISARCSFSARRSRWSW